MKDEPVIQPGDLVVAANRMMSSGIFSGTTILFQEVTDAGFNHEVVRGLTVGLILATRKLYGHPIALVLDAATQCFGWCSTTYLQRLDDR